MIYRAHKGYYTELSNRSNDSDISYLQGLRSHKLELVKSQVSPDAPPSFLTNTPLGEALGGSRDQSILYRDSNARKRQSSKKIKKTAWLLEELSFTMNKMSLAGLVFGLMVLGTLFFVIGFLAAVATLGTKNSPPQHASWAMLNSGASPNAGGASGAMGTGIVGRIAGKLIRDEAVKLESKVGGGALGGVITQHVPPALQPFAQQAQNKLAMTAQQNINRVSQPLIAGVRGPGRMAPAPGVPGSSPFAPHPMYPPSSNPGYPPPSHGYTQPSGSYTPPPATYTPPPSYAPVQRSVGQAPQGYTAPPPGYYPH